ncbi:MAG: DUF4412 domain-containing protein [Acidobacteria bacterium]|nr:DUF4412 domain-containing protein [Acidobacteriota bacterium]
MRSFGKIILAAAAVLALSGAAAAGVYIEQQNHMDAFTMMGQNSPEKNTIDKIYMETGKMAMQGEGNDVIVRLDLKKMYIVDRAAKTYQVADLPLQFPPEFAQMMSMMTFDVDVKKTGETRQVSGYNCEKVVLTLSGGMVNMKMTMTMWCTKDIKIPFGDYFEMSATMMSSNPSMKQMMDKMKSIDAGFPVESEMAMEVMGSAMRGTTKLLKVENKPIPAAVFDPPAGFKSEPLDFMKMMQKGGR